MDIANYVATYLVGVATGVWLSRRFMLTLLRDLFKEAEEAEELEAARQRSYMVSPHGGTHHSQWWKFPE